MRVDTTELPGVLVIEPRVFRDERGFFLETFHVARYAEHGITDAFVQDNHSHSIHGTLRGLHAQKRNAQAKLVRVVEGEVFDVAVDIRPDSPTFGRWVGMTLSGTNLLQVYIPSGFAHGFCVTSERAHVEYKCTAFYDADDEISIAWNDPALGIAWPLAEPRLSDKDRAAPRLEQIRDTLPRSR